MERGSPVSQPGHALSIQALADAPRHHRGRDFMSNHRIAALSGIVVLGLGLTSPQGTLAFGQQQWRPALGVPTVSPDVFYAPRVSHRGFRPQALAGPQYRESTSHSQPRHFRPRAVVADRYVGSFRPAGHRDPRRASALPQTRQVRSHYPVPAPWSTAAWRGAPWPPLAMAPHGYYQPVWYPQPASMWPGRFDPRTVPVVTARPGYQAAPMPRNRASWTAGPVPTSAASFRPAPATPMGGWRPLPFSAGRAPALSYRGGLRPVRSAQLPPPATVWRDTAAGIRPPISAVSPRPSSAHGAWRPYAAIDNREGRLTTGFRPPVRAVPADRVQRLAAAPRASGTGSPRAALPGWVSTYDEPTARAAL
jgi:hypothetical protein